MNGAGIVCANSGITKCFDVPGVNQMSKIAEPSDATLLTELISGTLEGNQCCLTFSHCVSEEVTSRLFTMASVLARSARNVSKCYKIVFCHVA